MVIPSGCQGPDTLALGEDIEDSLDHHGGIANHGRIRADFRETVNIPQNGMSMWYEYTGLTVRKLAGITSQNTTGVKTKRLYRVRQSWYVEDLVIRAHCHLRARAIAGSFVDVMGLDLLIEYVYVPKKLLCHVGPKGSQVGIRLVVRYYPVKSMVRHAPSLRENIRDTPYSGKYALRITMLHSRVIIVTPRYAYSGVSNTTHRGSSRHLESTTHQILALLFVAFEEKTAPAIVIRKAALPFCEPSLHLSILAVRFPWTQTSVITDGSSINSPPVVVYLDKCCK
jgi:hypothetical protein